MRSITSSGGVPRAFAMRRTFGWRSATSICGFALALGQLRHAVVGEHLVGEAAVLLGDRLAQHLLELLRVDLAHPLVLAGDHDVDAVRPVADVLIDPAALDLELLGRKSDGAQHTDAACLADGRDHVAAMAEGEDGKIDPETITDLCPHDALPFLLASGRLHHVKQRVTWRQPDPACPPPASARVRRRAAVSLPAIAAATWCEPPPDFSPSTAWTRCRSARWPQPQA
jgi:hypothetical protein